MANLITFNEAPKNSYQTMLAIRLSEKKATYLSTKESFGEEKANDAFLAKIKNAYEVHYGALAQNLDTYKACVSHFITFFPNIDAKEIDLAFSMVSANIIQPDKDVTPYRGEPSVSAFGAIMRAYDDYAKAKVREKKQADAQEMEEKTPEVERKNKEAIASAKETISNFAKQVKSGGAEMFDAMELVIGLLPMVIKSGLIVILDEEKVLLSKEAETKVIAKLNLERASQDRITSQKARSIYGLITEKKSYIEAYKASKELRELHHLEYCKCIFDFIVRTQND